CGNPGIELEPVETAVFESMRQYETELLQMPADAEEPVLVSERLLQMKEAELEHLREGVNRLQDLFVMGDPSKQDYTTRLERLRTLIVKKERNRLAKLPIERIDYTRSEDGIDVRVKFL
ncbi:MAG: hypothetical protein OWQ59_02440, partial [Alicyclobacillaceae bacterium]|nr:hypothetical protein [Alicyclobacillaceae bacterium]